MRLLITAATLAFLFSGQLARAELNVVASIKPVHSLVSAVMQGTGKPYLIVKSTGSPHGYNMKPSDALAMKKADLVFWIGAELETFLKKPVKSLSKTAKSVELYKIKGLELLKIREDHHDDHHDEHDKNEKHSEHDEHDEHKDGHKDEHGHHHETDIDLHVWMDPANGAKLVQHIAKVFSAKDPANKATYEANAKAYVKKLNALSGTVSKRFANMGDKSFMTFHDAYQYFEKRFGLKTAGVLAPNPEVQLSAKRLIKLKKKIKKEKVACLFLEPQFASNTASRLAKSLNIRTAVLDPLGSSIPNGPGLYIQLFEDTTKAIETCFKGK